MEIIYTCERNLNGCRVESECVCCDESECKCATIDN